MSTLPDDRPAPSALDGDAVVRQVRRARADIFAEHGASDADLLAYFARTAARHASGEDGSSRRYPARRPRLTQ